MLHHLLTNLIKSISQQRFLKLQQHLNIKTDKYNAIHINFNQHLPEIDFQNYMDEMIRRSLNTEITSIWVHLNQLEFKYATYLTSKQHFHIHHGKEKSLSLYRWILTGRKDLVVPYSMFHVGCGGVLIQNNQILLIQEKRGESKGKFAIPGGRADHGQGVKQSSQRQVFQELGIHTKFKNILWMRQLYPHVYGAFDIYYACLMKRDQPKQKLNICDYEIQKAQWIDLKDYRQFAKNNCYGTQRQLANYLCDLHDKGYDFNEESYKYKEQEYISPVDHKTRFFGQHKFLLKDKK